MNRIVSKLRDQLTARETELAAELAEVRAAVRAIDGLGGITAHQAAYTEDVRRRVSATQKARFADPAVRAWSIDNLARARAAKAAKAAARRANGADNHATA